MKSLGEEFIKEFCVPFLRLNGFEICKNKNKYADIEAEKLNKKFYFEVKYFKSGNENIIQRILCSQNQLLRLKSENDKCEVYLIVSCELIQQQKTIIEKQLDDKIKILDIYDLVFLCCNNFNLTKVLYAKTNFKIDQRKINNQFQDDNFRVLESDNILREEGESIKNELVNCPEANGSLYENACEKAIKFLFSNDLKGEYKQENTNNDIYKMDMICVVKETQEGFWDKVLHRYNSDYIVWEFKNYKNEIDQNHFYITEKYLHATALRNVAIIISKNGYKKNTLYVREGILREHGKLILALDNDDLIKMIDNKINLENPSDYLQQKLDNFLMHMCK